MTSGIGGLMGWALQLVVAYTVVDIDAVMSSEIQPWVGWYGSATTLECCLQLPGRNKSCLNLRLWLWFQ